MRRTTRVLAVSTTAALIVAGLANPGYAAIPPLSCDTSPINNLNQTDVRYSGMDGPLRPQMISADDTNPATAAVTNPSPEIAGPDGKFDGSLDLTSLSDGIITITATSAGPLATTATCTANKQTNLPPPAGAITTAPLAPINGAEQSSVAITASAPEAEITAVRLTVSQPGTTSAVANPTRASGGTWTSSFNLTGFSDGNFTVLAETFNAFGNVNATRSEVFVKNANAPGTPSIAVTSGATPLTRVNSSTPGTGNNVTVSGTSSTQPGDPVTHVVTITDSANTVLTPVVNQSGVDNKDYTTTFDPYVLADGTLTIRSTATDSFGNVGGTAETTRTKDTSVPKVTGLTVTPNPINAAGAGSVVVSGTVVIADGSTTASESGTQVTVTIPGGSGAPPQTGPIQADGSFSFTFNLSTYPDQTLTVTATAVDPRGNATSDPQASRQVVLDKTAPNKPDKPIVGNAIGNDLTVSISGGADSGTTVTVTVTDAAGVARTLPTFTTSGGTAGIANSGTWSGSFDATDFAEGTFSVVARATDAAGNTGPVSDARTGQKDTVKLAETAKSPTGPAAPSSTVRVSFNEPLSTTASTLEVRTVPGNVAVAGATSFADGNQTIVFTPSGGTFPSGSYQATYNVTESRPGLDRLGPVTFTFSIDSSAPVAPIITRFDPVNIANETNAIVEGTAEPLASILVTVTDSTTNMAGLPAPVTRTATATANATGAWSTTVNTSGQKDGQLTATATQTDAGSNTSGASAAKSSTKDTVRPTATVSSASDITQAAPSSTVTGTSNENGAPVTVTLTHAGSSTTATGTGTTGAGGAYSVQVNGSALAEGPIEVSVIVKDPAQNPNLPAATGALTKDTVGPFISGLAATKVDFAAGGKTTVSGQTNDGSTTVTVTITDSAGGSVADTPVPNAGAPGAFSKQIDVSGLAEGLLTIKAVSRDSRGNAGDEQQTTAQKDTIRPVITGLSATPTTATDDTTTVAGSTEAGATVAISVTDGAMTKTGSATAGITGSFTTEITLSGLADGSITVTATATDVIGNVGPTAMTTTTRDVTKPVITGLASTDTNAAQTKTTVTGTTEPGATVALRATSAGASTAVDDSVVAGSDGKFSKQVEIAGLNDGTITVTATATDVAGNVGDAFTATSTKDTGAPTIPTLNASDVNAASTVTTVTGTVSEAGADVTITITDGTTTVMKTLTDLPGSSFSTTLDLATLTDKPDLAVSAVATDAGGNSGAAATDTVRKDTVVPVITEQAATDTTSLQTMTTVTGRSEVGSTVSVSVTSPGSSAPATGSGTVGSGGTFSVQVETATLQDGPLTATVTATDPAGNPSAPKTATATKDTTGPTIATLAATATNTANTVTTVTGTTAASALVAFTVTSNGGAGSVTSTVTAGSDGAFTKAIEVVSLADGTLTVSAVAKDAQQNPGPAKTATAGKDTVAPALTGLGATGTSSATPKTTVTGTTDKGQQVGVTVTSGSSTATGTATGSATDGTFSVQIDLATFPEGTFTVAFSATDAAGNPSTASTTASKDSTGPAVTELAATATNAGNQVSTVTGKAETGSSVVVTATDGTKTATKTVTAAAGAFSTTLDLTGFADGTVTTTARATDTRGNAGAVSTTTAARDTSPPAITGLAATASSSSTPGSTVTGSTQAGSTVAITATDTAGKKVTGTATAAGNGSFSASLDLSTLADGNVGVAAVATDPAGNTGPTSTVTTTRTSTVPNQGRYTGLTAPVRVMDSRDGTGTAIGLKKGAVTLDLSSRIPAAASGVILNVTVTEPETGGFVVVYPAGSTQPPTSNVNFAKGQTQANEVVTAVSARKATVFVAGTGRAHVIVDLVGYFTPDTGVGGYLVTTTPKRVLGDALRRNLGSSSGPSSSVVVDLSSALPAGATAAILNVTVASPTLSGFVVVYPDGTNQPGTSNVNFGAGQVQANEVVTQVSATGKARLTLSRGSARIIVDVVGAVVPSSTAGSKRFTPLAAPIRALDTREALGTTGTARRTPSTPVELVLPSSVPADATGVILNVTSTNQVGSGFVVAYPTGTTQPGTSNVNFSAGSNQANEVVVGIGTGRRVTLAVGGGGGPATHLIADVVGYLR